MANTNRIERIFLLIKYGIYNEQKKTNAVIYSKTELMWAVVIYRGRFWLENILFLGEFLAMTDETIYLFSIS